jgi:hypothetical protein
LADHIVPPTFHPVGDEDDEDPPAQSSSSEHGSDDGAGADRGDEEESEDEVGDGDGDEIGGMDAENWRKNRTVITRLQKTLVGVMEELAALVHKY